MVAQVDTAHGDGLSSSELMDACTIGIHPRAGLDEALLSLMYPGTYHSTVSY